MIITLAAKFARTVYPSCNILWLAIAGHFAGHNDVGSIRVATLGDVGKLLAHRCEPEDCIKFSQRACVLVPRVSDWTGTEKASEDERSYVLFP